MAPRTPKQRRLVLQDDFRDDLEWWVKTDRKTALRLLGIIDAIMRDPFTGIGKPEPLRHLGPGIWSRRITREHRIVYRVTDEQVDLLQGRYHY